jgi:Dyp-type peroxidase family
VGGARATIEWPEWHDDLPGNVLGCAHAFTAFAPMPWWAALGLSFKFKFLRIFPRTELRRHHFVYFGRWTMLPWLPGTGKWQDRYLLIETNYNGSFSEYLDTLSVDLAANLKRIWGPCYECPPGMQPPSAFRRWARTHELPAQHYFCAYPEATVKQIEFALVAQATGSPEEAEKAIREVPRLSLLDRLRAPGRLLRPDRASPAGAATGAVRDSPVSAVTYLTPVVPDMLEALRRRLAEIEEEARSPRGRSPFERVEGIHVARWVVVDRLLNPKVSDRPLDLNPPMLLFGAVGDGEPGQFRDRLCEQLPGHARGIWTEHCVGADARSLPRYLHRHRLRDGLLFAGYRASTDTVKTALREWQMRGPVAPGRAAGLGTSVAAVRKDDFGDVQGNILKGYQLPYGGFLLVSISNAARGRLWLREVLHRQAVTSAAAQDHRPRQAHNLAFTYAGLRILGVPERLLKSFPEDFRQGMQLRAWRLGDDNEVNKPTKWEKGLTDADGGHVMLMLRAEDPALRDTLARKARWLAWRHRLAVVYEEKSDPVAGNPGDAQKCGPGEREPFGFADGCSQPAILGTRASEDNEYQRVRAGEILLGYLDEDGMIPGEARFFRNGSFMVFRKLEQRVDAFEQVLKHNAERNAGELSEEDVAAKIVGRRRDGQPLVLERKGDDVRDPRTLNDFGYGSPADGPHSSGYARDRRDDPYGFRCPLGAHIRRAFPRDALAGGSARTRRHRILRRGMPYERPASGKRRERECGLLFICFNASIARQFETVQGWCLDGSLFDVPGEPDFLLGPSRATMTIQREGEPYRLTRTEPLVITRGGGYFFYPGVTALEAIATGDYFGQEDELPR